MDRKEKKNILKRKNSEIILRILIFKEVIEAELKIIILTGLLKQPDSKSGFPLYCVDFLTKQDCKIKQQIRQDLS